MRLDKFLKVSRVIKRRTVANDAADAGRVCVNDKVAKASYEIKIGDVIDIRFGSNTTRIRVLSLSEHVKKDEASAMYETLS